MGQTELLKRCTSGDLDLSSNDIDTRDFLGDGVLDLDTGVDLDEIIPIRVSTKTINRISGVYLFCWSTRNSAVPALRYLTDWASLTASARMASRVSIGKSFAGAISTTFW